MPQPASSDPRKQLVESGYDRIAERYLDWAAGIDDPGRERMLELLLERLPRSSDVLDLGCGAGVPSTVRLAKRHRVTGVDISREQLRLARQRLPDAELVHADLASVEFPDASFDGVTCFYALGHLPREQLGEVFRSVRGWLRPGGWFLTSLAAGDQADATGEWLGVEMHFSGYSPDRNSELLREAGFRIDVDEVVPLHEPEGTVTFQWVIATPDAEG
jgi:ubiquinone/menaquinone biosynthesis C-methylase UbiE